MTHKMGRNKRFDVINTQVAVGKLAGSIICVSKLPVGEHAKRGKFLRSKKAER